MNKEKLSRQHAELKSQLAELVDFINSEEYYKQSDGEKQLIATQRAGMEMTINAMSVRLWGNQEGVPSINTGWMALLPMLMASSSFGSTTATAQLNQLEEERKE